MKLLHIFRPGKHTSSSGTELSFSEDDVRAAAEAYDPKIHEAPIVVGHPRENAPAFGWISGLSYSEEGLHAEPHQVNEDFAEQVRKGAYKKISASFYTPDAKNNPAPGSLYLRHVGFLGAQPPAIKGLKGIEFSDAEEGTIEFSADFEVAGVFRRMREFFIEKFGIEDADKAIPAYLVESAEDIARHPTPTEQPEAAFSESTEDNAMTPEEIKAAEDKLKAEQDALAAEKQALEDDKASFSEQQKAAEAEALATRKGKIKERVDALVKAGKITPAKAEGAVSFAQQLEADAVVEFGEGDQAKKENATEWFFSLLEQGKSPVDFNEHGAPGEGNTKDLTAEELANQALEYREECRQKGREISYSEAVNHIAQTSAAA